VRRYRIMTNAVRSVLPNYPIRLWPITDLMRLTNLCCLYWDESVVVVSFEPVLNLRTFAASPSYVPKSLLLTEGWISVCDVLVTHLSYFCYYFCITLVLCYYLNYNRIVCWPESHSLLWVAPSALPILDFLLES
jgi:hypothetical protein